MQLDQLVYQERPALTVQQVLLVHQVYQVHWVQLVLLEQQETRAQQAQQGQRVQLVQQDRWAKMVPQVQLDPWGCKERPVSMDQLALLVQQDR